MKHEAIAKLLVENGADVEACAKNDGSYMWLDPGITRERWHKPIVIVHGHFILEFPCGMVEYEYVTKPAMLPDVSHTGNGA